MIVGKGAYHASPPGSGGGVLIILHACICIRRMKPIATIFSDDSIKI